jgi:hypothetical protein
VSSTISRMSLPNRILHRIGGGFQRAFIAGPYGSARMEKAIEVRLTPLLPLALAISAILWQQGAELVKPGGDRKAWQKLLLQSGVGALLLEHTRSIYPVWGMGVGAFEAGKAPNTLEKAHSLATTAFSVLFGWGGYHRGGYHLMKGFSMEAQQQENQDIRKSLESDRIKKWIAHLKTGAVPGGQDLAQRLEWLGNVLKEEKTMVEQEMNPMDREIKAVRKELMALKTDALERILNIEREIEEKRMTWTRFLPDHGDKNVEKLYNSLRNTMRDSTNGFVRFTRAINPVAGFILGGMMLGGIAAGYFNDYLTRRFPHWRQSNRLADIFYDHAALIPNHNHMAAAHTSTVTRPDQYRPPNYPQPAQFSGATARHPYNNSSVGGQAMPSSGGPHVYRPPQYRQPAHMNSNQSRQ